MSYLQISLISAIINSACNQVVNLANRVKTPIQHLLGYLACTNTRNPDKCSLLMNVLNT